MGCDIHSIGQVLIDDKWVTEIVRVAKDGRHYNTFGLLAGIRGGWVEPLFEPRGLPDDLIVDRDFNVKLDKYYFDEYEKAEVRFLWLGDYGHSYLTLTELKQIYRKHKNDSKEELSLLIQIIRELEALKKEYRVSRDEVRYVFGFDS
jgi:hypothetical protein